jgi:deoxycytidylate deaminase
VSRYAKGESPYLCPHIHAEWAALNKARGVVDTVVIYRERKDGSAAMARPCNVCMALLKARGVRLVIYTGKDGLPLMEKI